MAKNKNDRKPKKTKQRAGAADSVPLMESAAEVAPRKKKNTY